LREKITKKQPKKRIKKQKLREWITYLIYKQNKIKWKWMKLKKNLKTNLKQRKTNKKKGP
jgi:hypothetical protein